MTVPPAPPLLVLLSIRAPLDTVTLLAFISTMPALAAMSVELSDLTEIVLGSVPSNGDMPKPNYSDFLRRIYSYFSTSSFFALRGAKHPAPSD